MRSSEQKGSKKQLSLQDFEIEYKLGEGAYGYVFLASRHNEQFAIKELSKFKLKRQNREYQPIVEKEVLRAVNHPGIIKNICAFQNTNYLYLVLEYCLESQLEPLIKNNLLTEESRRFYVAELVNIIQYLHSHGIIHRDLKPSNLLLSKKRHLKLIDFGTADITHSDLISQSFKDKLHQMKLKKKQQQSQTPLEKVMLKKRSTFVGTAEFLSPELVEHSQCVAASDLWALGCTIYALYYGHGPFQQACELQSYKSIQSGSILFPKNQSVGGQVKDLISRLLVKQPEKRLGSCSCPQLSFNALKHHPYFRGIDVNSIFESQPPQIETPQSQIQQKLMELKLSANLSFKEPGFGNILEKILVKIDEDNEGIYLCHFKKELKLMEYQTISSNDQPIIYNLSKDQDQKVAHLLSESKFSIGVEDGQRLIYSSRDSKSICQLLNDYYCNKAVRMENNQE